MSVQAHPKHQDPQNTGETDYNGGQGGRGRGRNRSSCGLGNGGNSDNWYDNQDRGAGHGQGQRDFQYNRGQGQENTFRGRRRQWDGNDSNNCDRDNRDRNSEGQGNSNRGRRWDNSRGQGHSDQGRRRRWNPNQQYHEPGYHQQTQFANPNHYRPPPMEHQYRYPIPYEQYSYPSNNNTSRKCHQLHHNKRQIFVNYVRVRAIMIINANLQAILWPTHKKPSTMAAHITTKILIMGSGHMATLIIMTLMGNLFSSRGS